MFSKNVKVLITGAGAPGAPGIIENLRDVSKTIEITGVDANEEAAGKLLVDKFSQVPKANDPNFIPKLLEIAKSDDIDVILPLVTRELLPFSENKAEFETIGTKVLISNPESLTTANNKALLYKALKAKKIAVPKFKVANTLEEFEAAVHELAYPKKRVVFKPSLANGSRGFRIIDDSIDKSCLLFDYKPNSVFINLNEILEILKIGIFPQLLLSEYLPGDEYSVDCLLNHGKAIFVIPRKRTRILNGISIAGEFIENQEIIRYVKRIVEALDLHGNIGVQVKANEAGKFKILEINPRVQGTIVTNKAAGVNLPALAIAQELGKTINPEEYKIKWGTKFTRIWRELYF